MKKRIVSLLLALCMLCAMMPATASAAEETLEYKVPETNTIFFYQVKEDNTIVITGCSIDWGLPRALEIPAEIEGKPVTAIGEEAFHSLGLISVTIPDSVTSIGKRAFSNNNLTSIEIPKSVTTIEDHVFGSNDFTSFTIPDWITAIGDEAFFYCEDLASIMIPDSVTTIGEGTFFGCGSLTSVVIPDSITTIRYSTFGRCYSLTSVTIPDSVTTIENMAFEDCTALTSITIPDSVTFIDYWAFCGCTSLTSAYLPSTAAYGADHPFNKCPNLSQVYIDGKLLPRLSKPHIEMNVDSYHSTSAPGLLSVSYNTEEMPLVYLCNDNRRYQRFAWLNKKGEVVIVPDNRELEDGDYYWQSVTSGDYKNFIDSETVTSDIWTFKKPTAQLESVSVESLKWDGLTTVWNRLSDESHTCAYQEDLYYSETEEGEFRPIARRTIEIDGPGDIGNIYDYDIEFYTKTHGSGYYYFTVTAVSNDLLAYLHSETVSSPALYVEVHDVVADLEKALEGITEGDDVRQEVQKIPTEDLKTALLADKNEAGGASDMLKRLEEKTGLTVDVSVAEELSAIAENSVSIVGAALNDVPAETEKITLKIDRAAEEHTLPLEYNNTVALQFSMGLEGVTNQEALKVPVRVTLPVPATINPRFLRILHYRQDGKVEEVNRYLFTENGKWYASIVLTSFSDFVMTEQAKSTGGNGGGGSGGGSGASIAPTKKDEDKKGVDISEVYRDIPKDAWFADAVAFVTEQELMKGTEENMFAPDENLSRAMLAQILYNREGKPQAGGSGFDDVLDGAWYADAVAWAAQKDIVNGYGDGKFGPNDNISREQLAVMLWRYAGKPEGHGDLSVFTDIEKAGDYARAALSWAVEKGIINGKGDGILDPTGGATRAETAQMLMNYYK